jgi:hypothetical protein
VLVVSFFGPSVTSASADERAELQRLQGTISALEGRIRRLEGQVRRLEGRLAQAVDREKPTIDDDLKSAILKAMYRLAEHTAMASEDAELMRALADVYAKLDKAEGEVGPSRRGPGRADQPRRTRPPERDTDRPTAMLGVAIKDDGAVIQVLPGTPAEEVGIKEGDVIKRIDGRAVDSAMDIVQAVARRKPGDRVTIELLRGEEKIDVKTVLARRSDR